MFQNAVKRLRYFDESLSLKCYVQTKNNKFLSIIAEIFSFSGDETLWFGIPSGVGCLLFIVRIFGLLRGMGCIEEALWDCFGSSAGNIIIY